METKEKIIVSIDVSRETLVVYWKGLSAAKSYSNDSNGLEKLVVQIEKIHPTLVVLESTGGYEQAVCQLMWKRSVPLVRVNPGRVRHFCNAKGYLAKTDDIDAKALYEFGMAMELEPQAVPSPEIEAIKQLFLRRQQLKQMIVAEKNHMKAPCANKAARTSIKKMLIFLQREVQRLDAQIARQIGSIPEIASKVEVLKKEKCVGPVLLTALVAVLPELGTLNRRTIASLAGLAPYNKDSGSSEGKRSIRGGRTEIRTVLYMATLSAIRRNGTIKSFYRQLLKRGKLKMVAITACMRKFLIHLNSVVCRALSYDAAGVAQAA